MKRFRVTYKRRNSYFDTLAEAVAFCSRVFKLTGIVLGIEEVKR